MNLATASQIAKTIGIGKVRVNQLLHAGRFVGARKIGGLWMIPIDEEGKPERLSAQRKEQE